MFLVIVVMLGILGVALAVLSHTADRGRNDNDD